MSSQWVLLGYPNDHSNWNHTQPEHCPGPNGKALHPDVWATRNTKPEVHVPFGPTSTLDPAQSAAPCLLLHKKGASHHESSESCKWKAQALVSFKKFSPQFCFLRYYLHRIKFIHFKYKTGWILTIIYKCVTTITIKLSFPEKVPLAPSSSTPPHPSRPPPRQPQACCLLSLSFFAFTRIP